MKAIVCEKCGTPDVLEVKKVKKLTLKDEEVLVKVQAASMNYPDWGLLRSVFIVRIMGQGLFAQKNYSTRI